MSANVERGITGHNNGEDFAELLEQSLRTTNMVRLLEQKGDIGRMSGDAGAGKRSAVNEGDNRLFLQGLGQKESGLLEESYASFEEILQTKGLLPKHRHLAIKNLADISVRQFNATALVPEKLKRAEQAHYWFDQLRETKYENELPNSKLHTAIQSGRFMYNHQLLVDSPDQQRQLLSSAYFAVEAVREIIPDDRPGWLFIFHATVHLIARKYSLLAVDDAGKRQWLKRLYDSAEAIIKLPYDSRRQGENDFFKNSMAYTSKMLADVEPDKSQRLVYLLRSYGLFTQVLKLEEESAYSDYIGMGVAASAASMVAHLMQDPAGKEQWIENAYRLNRKAAELSLKNGKSEAACLSLQFCIKDAVRIIALELPSWPRWKRTQLEDELLLAQLTREQGNLA